mmetsp:Transcript_42941/g.91045  ORF Transcript_42941/g.91045 Transcript_42941/m.91045 type:complete len:221 (-) Transcript_42941:188-850(-)
MGEMNRSIPGWEKYSFFTDNDMQRRTTGREIVSPTRLERTPKIPGAQQEDTKSLQQHKGFDKYHFFSEPGDSRPAYTRHYGKSRPMMDGADTFSRKPDFAGVKAAASALTTYSQFFDFAHAGGKHQLPEDEKNDILGTSLDHRDHSTGRLKKIQRFSESAMRAEFPRVYSHQLNLYYPTSMAPRIFPNRHRCFDEQLGASNVETRYNTGRQAGQSRFVGL